MVPSARRTGRGRTRGLAPPGRPGAHPRRRGEARPQRRYSAEAGWPASGGCGERPRPDGRRGGKRGRPRNARTRPCQVRRSSPPLAGAPMRKGPEREADAADANLVIGERRGHERNGPFRAERTVGAKCDATLDRHRVSNRKQALTQHRVSNRKQALTQHRAPNRKQTLIRSRGRAEREKTDDCRTRKAGESPR